VARRILANAQRDKVRHQNPNPNLEIANKSMALAKLQL
jgi:hypothetical protein